MTRKRRKELRDFALFIAFATVVFGITVVRLIIGNAGWIGATIVLVSIAYIIGRKFPRNSCDHKSLIANLNRQIIDLKAYTPLSAERETLRDRILADPYSGVKPIPSEDGR
jgi:hypothetical protein